MADTENLADLTRELNDLTKYFYIAVAVLSCVLALVVILCMILYYWIYVLEKSITKSKSGQEDEAGYKIRRPVLRDEPKQLPVRQSDCGDPRHSQSPNQNQSSDPRNFKNPLTNNLYQQAPSVPFKQQLQQQLQQNNQRYSNQNGMNDIKRNPRHTEQQLHQNFYGVDNGNFQY